MKKFTKIFIIKSLDFKKFLWYNIRALRLRAKSQMKKFPKIFISKLLDFKNFLWYNINVKNKGHG